MSAVSDAVTVPACRPTQTGGATGKCAACTGIAPASPATGPADEAHNADEAVTSLSLEPDAPVSIREAQAGTIEVVRDATGGAVRLGHGGNKGSCVYLVRCNGEKRALKACGINASELELCRALQSLWHKQQQACCKSAAAAAPNGVAPAAPSSESDVPSPSSPSFDVSQLAVPLYLATRDSFETPQDMQAVTPAALAAQASTDGRYVGIVMPLFDCNLHRLLTSPSVDFAFCPGASPLTPAMAGSPVSDSRLGGTMMMREMPTREDASSASGSEDDESGAFHRTARQRRVQSLIVMASLLEPIVRALATLHEGLPHAIDGTSFSGFAHQDLRADNVLLSRNGDVVLCDFELVGHVSTEASPTSSLNRCSSGSISSASPLGGSRLLPTCMHAPEGPNAARSDSWLVGLLAVELFTGVAPLIRPSIAFDDFGDGPFLSVDPDNGIDWVGIRAHVHRHVRPFPSDPESIAAVGYTDKHVCTGPGQDHFDAIMRLSRSFEDFCEACLANDPQRRACPAELANHSFFDVAQQLSSEPPKEVLAKWIRSVGPTSPALRAQQATGI